MDDTLRTSAGELRFSSLGSGSEGNALLVASGSGEQATCVMIDCGFGLREAERRLSRRHINPGALSGIIVTHEHDDHIGGVFKLARRYQVPVWLTHGSFSHFQHEAQGIDVRFCVDGRPFQVGGLELCPFTVPHDAREPVQYTLTDGRFKLGVLTDIGHVTPYVCDHLSGCDALLLEFNHDGETLARSAYPPWLKSRIAGPLGHLSNQQAAELLQLIDRRRLVRLIAAHLSQKNNTPSMVQEAIRQALHAEDGVDVVIADQAEGFGWINCLH